MSWEQLGAISRRQRTQLEAGDVYTDPGDGSPPTNCPLCFTRLRFRDADGGAEASCPYGHYRWPEA